MISLADAVEAFLRGREVSGATQATLRTYAFTLDRFSQVSGVQMLSEVTPRIIERHLGDLRARMKPISVHQPFRVLRTFCRWCVNTGYLTTNPMAGMTMRTPKTLPYAPDDADVRQLLDACPNTPEGRRNRGLVALAADSGLRKEELRRLRIGDLDFGTGAIRIHDGKGQKDGVGFFGEATASMLRTWMSVHPNPRPAAFVFATREGIQLGPHALLRIMHRLSRRAGLDRKIGPHALRHYAATAILRRTGDLELVRRVLRHESLTMTLRYVALAQTEVATKYHHASPLDHLQSGFKSIQEPSGRSSGFENRRGWRLASIGRRPR